MNRRFLAPVLLLLSYCLPAVAEERAWMPYRKLVETVRLDKFYALPENARDKVTLFATIKPENEHLKPADLALTVLHGGEKQALPVTADGKIFMVPNAKWLAQDAVIWINQPKDEKIGIGFGIQAVIPSGTHWRYASLMGSVKQSTALIKSQAGMFSVFTPKIKSVVLRFAKPAQLRIQAKGGVRMMVSDAKGDIWLKPDAGLMQENPLMTLSERPFEADLETD
jgi:hypothetical protein